MEKIFYLILIIIMCSLLIAQCYYSVRSVVLCISILQSSSSDFKEKYYHSGGTRFTIFRLKKFITKRGVLIQTDFNYYVEKAKVFTILNIGLGSCILIGGLWFKKFQ